MRSVVFLSFFVGVAASCGIVIVDPIDQDSGNAAASSSASGTGGSPPTDGGGGMCNLPPPPSPTQPTEGCGENMGSGWIQVPCSCEIWLENTTHAPILASIELSVAPPDEVPTLTGTLDVEISFDDPGASWYATWASQPDNGSGFVVTNQAGKTTVRMGESNVTLSPVPVAACTTSKGNARVFGSNSAALSMHAVADGAPFGTSLGPCSNPPPEY